MADASTDSAEKKGRKSHLGLIILVLVLAIAVAAYVAGILYFGTHTMPNTTVNGEDASNLSSAQLAAQLEEGSDDYVLTVSGEGLNLTITAADIDYEIDGDALAAQVIEAQSPTTWPVGLTEAHSAEVEATPSYDEAKLEGVISDAVNDVNGTEDTSDAATSPVIEFDEESQQFKLSSSSTSYLVNAERATAKAKAAIDAGETSVTLDSSDLDENSPVVEGLETANSWLNAADMHLYLGDTDVYTITASQIASYVSFDEEGNPSLDSDAILEWTKGELSDQLDTVGIARTYTRPDGKEVSVEGGAYGWSTNGEQEATDIEARILAGDNSDYTLPCYQTAAIVNYGGKDWTGNWIDVDITEQHARLYDDDGNILWEADVVTGNTDGTHDTPEGTWYITEKLTDITLIGPEVDGEPEWQTPVKYWYGVVGSRIGLHSAQWRSEFGGNIYTYYGSHGCINISEEKAAEIYDYIEVGMAIVTHY